MLHRKLVMALVVLPALSGALPADELYAPPAPETSKQAALEWARTRSDWSDDAQALVDPLWRFEGKPSPARQFDAVLQTFYLADRDVRALVDACTSLTPPTSLVDFPALHTSSDYPFYSHNVRAFYARYLAMMRLYEEALEIYEELDPQHLVDPATSLFYRAVCEHALLHREEGLETITKLLENTEGVPLRYATVAELMKHDLEALKEKTLGEVARQMRDVERRLELGRAGQRVQRVEERIIATLDEIIEKIEQQQGGGGGGGGQQSGPQNSPPGSPADESYVGGMKGPGEVDPKKIDHEAGWGNLPEKEQAEVKNMLDKQFPSHYRQAVTEYLRKLGQRPAPSRN